MLLSLEDSVLQFLYKNTSVSSQNYPVEFSVASKTRQEASKAVIDRCWHSMALKVIPTVLSL